MAKELIVIYKSGTFGYRKNLLLQIFENELYGIDDTWKNFVFPTRFPRCFYITNLILPGKSSFYLHGWCKEKGLYKHPKAQLPYMISVLGEFHSAELAKNCLRSASRQTVTTVPLGSVSGIIP